MVNILMVPLPEAGHLSCFAAAADVLTQRGHSVTWGAVAGEEVKISTLLGVEPVPVASIEPPNLRWNRSALTGTNLVVVDGMRPLGATLAKVLDVGAIVLDTSMPPLSGDQVPGSEAGDKRLWFPEAAFHPDVENLTRVVACPRDLEIAGGPDDPNIRYGPALIRRSAPKPVPDLPGEFVFVSVGTRANTETTQKFYQWLLEEGSALNEDFVVAAGAIPPPRPLPPRFHWEGHLPQQALLDRCTGAIIHGGLNSLKEALAARAPIIVAPQMDDQFANAERVRRLEIGAVAAAPIESANLGELLKEARSDATRARAIALADKLEAPSHLDQLEQWILEAATWDLSPP